MNRTKTEWLTAFRAVGRDTVENLKSTTRDKKTQAGEINKSIKAYRDKEVLRIERTARIEHWGNEKLLNEILLLIS